MLSLPGTSVPKLLKGNVYSYVAEAAHNEPRYRSAVQESALVVSLQMFNLILEKCVFLLREQLDNPTDTVPSRFIVSEDLQILLPAVKVQSKCAYKINKLPLLYCSIPVSFLLFYGKFPSTFINSLESHV